MRTITILSGAYGKDNGRGGVTVIRRGQSCQVDDAEAERLIAAGAAAEAPDVPGTAPEPTEAYHDTPNANEALSANESVSEEPADEPEPDAVKGHLDEAELMTMTLANLKKLAAELEVDTAGCRTKADYAARIAAAEVPIPDEDGEEPPELTAEEPVL